jgi:hypothetical protein
MMLLLRVALAAVTTGTRERRLNVLLAPVRRCSLLNMLRLVDGGQLRLLSLTVGLRLARLRHRALLLMLVVYEHLILGILFDKQHLVRWALRCTPIRLPELLLRGSLLLLRLLNLFDLRTTLTVLLLDEHGLTQGLLVGSRTGAARGS